MPARWSTPLPPVEVLQERWEYHPTTGAITKRGKAKTLGYLAPNGRVYLSTTINGAIHVLLAHRVAWALYHGKDPYPHDIDHVNRNPSDNSIINLRLTTPADNNKNRRMTGRYRPVRITSNDGGSITTRNMALAAYLLHCPSSTLQNALRRGQQHLRQHGNTYTIAYT